MSEVRDELKRNLKAQSSPKPQPKAAPRRRKPLSDDEYKAAVAQSVLRGALLGFGDEASAGVMSVLPGRGTYEQELAMARDLQDRLDEADPVASYGASAGGAIPTAMMAAPALHRSVGLGAYEAAGDIGPLMPFRMFGPSVVGGTAAGGAYGYGSGRGQADRTDRAKRGAAAGAMVGGLAGAGSVLSLPLAASVDAFAIPDILYSGIPAMAAAPAAVDNLKIERKPKPSRYRGHGPD